MARATKQKEFLSRGSSGNILTQVQKAWGESPFYQAKLNGPAPDRVLFQPTDPYAPDKELALCFVNGRLRFGDESIDCEGNLETIWEEVAANGPLEAFLQEFSWLRHLEALDVEGSKVAKKMLRSWLDRYERWSAEAWDHYFVSERLVQLCSHFPLVLTDSDALWRSRVLTAMARQTRHLAITAHRAGTGFERLMTALGLCIAGFCLPGCEGPAQRGLEMARRELRLQLRADGGHVSRNPSRQLKLAVRLQTVLKVIEARGFQAPGFLRHTVLRASAMAEFFRCADGKLAVFNGGYEDDSRAVLSIHNAVSADASSSSFARHTGYHKLSAGRSLLIMDSADDSGAQRFKGSGAIHFSSGRSRLIVNCGNGGHRAPQWRQALEQRAAHSALSFEEGRGPGFGGVSHRRAEDVKGQLIEFERQLLPRHSESARYCRRLYLAGGGADLRGEEFFEGLAGDALSAAVWRFHLHPGVRASLARDKRSVILLLPNKEGWRFKSNCPELFLEKTIYCGEGRTPQAAEQIVLKASAYSLSADGGSFTAKWAVQRLDAV